MRKTYIIIRTQTGFKAGKIRAKSEFEAANKLSNMINTNQIDNRWNYNAVLRKMYRR